MMAVPHAVSLSVDCSAAAVDALFHKLDAVCCDGSCSAHEGGCSDPSVVAVPTAVSLNVDAVLRQWMQCPTMWMQCPTMWMQYVLREDAVPIQVEVVILQWLRCPLQCP